jgi:hypothetical protein
VLACAASAGAHAGIVPEHLRSEPRLGVAFLFAVAMLVAAAVALSVRPDDRRLVLATATLLGGLIAAYAATRTTGIPLLAPDPEGPEAVGVVTNAVEALGLVLAIWLAQPRRREGRGALPWRSHDERQGSQPALHLDARRARRARQHDHRARHVRRARESRGW